MTVKEAKDAFASGVPVTHTGIQYDAVTALIYRMRPDGKMYLTLELHDKNGRCVVIVRVEDAEVVKNGRESR